MPENFIGGVIILYNQPDGITPETAQDGTILYRIPQDGFLKVKSPLKRIPYKFNYYFVNDKDERKPIEYLHPEAYVRNPGDTTSKSHDSITEDERVNGVFIMNHRNISFDVNGSKVIVNGFSVGRPKDSISLYVSIDDRVNAIEKKLSKNQP